MRKLFIVFILFLGCSINSSCFAQWEAVSAQKVYEELKQSNSWFKNNQAWSVRIKYETFAGHLSTEVIEKSESIIRKYGNAYHTVLMDLYSIQDNKLKITIDSMEQVILISEPEIIESFVPVDTLSIAVLALCKELNVRKIENNTIYRLVFKENNIYDAIEITMGEDSRIKKMRLFLNNLQALNPDDENSRKEKPRLDMTFYEYRTKFPYKASEFDINSYVKFNSDGIVAAEKYNDFKIKDTRYKN